MNRVRDGFGDGRFAGGPGGRVGFSLFQLFAVSACYLVAESISSFQFV